MVPLKLVPLTDLLCGNIGERLSQADLIDCAAHDYDGVAALRDCMLGGPSCAVCHGDDPIGAIGWTEEGYIWSLWTDLTRDQMRAVMARTPELIRQMAQDAQRPLMNVVWEGNRATRAWLRASHCFDFLEDRLQYKGKTFIPFFVKPLGDLAHV